MAFRTALTDLFGIRHPILLAPMGGVSMYGSSLWCMRPRDTQLRLSAHTSMGGRTTSALNNATNTFIATIRPKSRSSGSDENDSAQAFDTVVADPALSFA